MSMVVRRLVIWAVIVGLAVIGASLIGVYQRMPTGEGKAFDVRSADVTVAVQPDASLIVTERLTFRYSGQFRGAYRDIPLQDGVSVSDVTVSDGEYGTYRPGASTVLGSTDTPGTMGAAPLDGGGVRVVWHYQQSGGTRTYDLTYRVRGAAKAYDDALIVPWAVWGDQWTFWLDRLTARITVAEPASGDGRPVEGWMRPDDRGVAPELSADGLAIELERSRPEQQVALTAAFPRSVVRSVNGATTESGSGLELTRQAEEQASGSVLRRIGAQITALQQPLLVLATLLFGVIAFVLFRAGREREVGVPEYLHGPPADLPPAVAFALAHEGHDTDRLVLATLLDLVDRGYYRADSVQGKELDLRLAVAERRPDAAVLQDFERTVLEFFDALLAKGGPCELAKLKDRIPEHSSTWRRRWTAMNEALAKAGDERIAWDLDLRSRRNLVALAALGVYGLIFAAGLQRNGYWAFPVAGLIAAWGLLFLLPGTWLQRRDPDSMRVGAEWAAFARWTNDFPRLDDDPPATLALWRRVLVYAVAFGTADRVIKSGRIPAPVQESDDGWSRGMTHGVTYPALTGSAFGSAFASQVAPKSSSSSGGGGGGGGFSGGGGGGAW